MGWLFQHGVTRQDIVDDIVRFEENEHGVWETLRHSLRGNVLWCIVQWTNKKTGDVKEDSLSDCRSDDPWSPTGRSLCG